MHGATEALNAMSGWNLIASYWSKRVRRTISGVTQLLYKLLFRMCAVLDE